jgi:hypothetical protein
METTLHRQLKDLFKQQDGELEARVGRFRIDIVNGNRLVEIQFSGLASIRDKVRCLLANHDVDVIKPLIVRKKLVKLRTKNGSIVERRWSPRRGSILDLFDELVYFTTVFPHPKLRLIATLIEIEEQRYPGHGRRRRWRADDYIVEDRSLTEVVETYFFRSAHDLCRLLPDCLPNPFVSGQLAHVMSIPLWKARQIAYVLSQTGAAATVGKRRNAKLYELLTCSGTGPGT